MNLSNQEKPNQEGSIAHLQQLQQHQLPCNLMLAFLRIGFIFFVSFVIERNKGELEVSGSTRFIVRIFTLIGQF